MPAPANGGDNESSETNRRGAWPADDPDGSAVDRPGAEHHQMAGEQLHDRRAAMELERHVPRDRRRGAGLVGTAPGGLVPVGEPIYYTTHITARLRA